MDYLTNLAYLIKLTILNFKTNIINLLIFFLA